ncbi:FAD:protein FMN transferase [Parabacteroides sp. PF5-6]|uniref:FAD:protein FMN transferase n=1 Tax=Parabacteroides sp. PF5-6 TaxID=1742403 RepID=UPI002406AE33|nr:FAD:protein FMN transferase [Parabacteroides sp. PF5-6]MDF9831215.1 thiamine biosynthesis lipoprotein [Parabacteroides sp. PF5-6]
MKKIVYLGLSVLFFISCQSNTSYFEESGSVFHTLYQIKYEAPKLMTEEIDAALAEVNLSLNPFNPNAIIAKVNRNEEVETDEHFRTVFNKAMEISVHTEGMFDITSGPLINIWGFGTTKNDVVSPQLIDSIKQFVGYRKVRLEGNRVIKDDPRIQLNCSAIAKGYACDVVAAMLESHGIKNYMVDIGGESTINGVNAKGQGWRVGIRKPEEVTPGKAITIEEVIQLNKKGGIATSGDYQNYYIKDGKKFAHTISPVTGYPAEQDILSCTIVAENCMTADGYATALMASGMKEAIRIADTLKKFEYYLIYMDEKGSHKIKYSEGMIPYLPNRKELAVLESSNP